jgi:hypothetical protein
MVPSRARPVPVPEPVAASSVCRVTKFYIRPETTNPDASLIFLLSVACLAGIGPIGMRRRMQAVQLDTMFLIEFRNGM